jgi:hypothetical protein
MKKKAPLPTGRGAFLHGVTGSGGGMCPHGKVILFSKSRWIFATAKGNGCLFVENTQSLFEKGKTDVQGAENQQVKQIDMAQMSNCDKIKVDMRICTQIVRIGKQQ